MRRVDRPTVAVLWGGVVLGGSIGVCCHQLSATAMMSPQMRVVGEGCSGSVLGWVGKGVSVMFGNIGGEVEKGGGVSKSGVGGLWLVASSIIVAEPSAVTYTS